MNLILRNTGHPPSRVLAALSDAGIAGNALPRELRPEQWATLWTRLGVDDGRSARQ